MTRWLRRFSLAAVVAAVSCVVGTAAVEAQTTCGALCQRAFWDDADAAKVRAILAGGASAEIASNPFSPFAERWRWVATGWTALHFAATYSKDPTAVPVLLEAGANIFAADTDGGMPHHFAACCNAEPALLRALLAAGAPITRANRYGNTALHLAGNSQNNPAVITLLVRLGAFINEVAPNGWTPLHWAASANPNPLVAGAMLDAGADAALRDRSGNTPYQLALRNRAYAGSSVLRRLEAAQ